jgi:hypothetical protein
MLALPAMEPPVHPDVQPIAFLLGSWRGEGQGAYPTVQPFAYGEEVRFWQVGKPFLAYSQRTWATDDGRPLHAEMGYWRPQPDGRLELTMAHPTGVTEIAEGTVDGTTIEVASTVIGLTGSAKEVTRLERLISVDGDTMTYQLRMAAVGEPLALHLTAELKRT